MRFLDDPSLYRSTARCLDYLRALGPPPEPTPGRDREPLHVYWQGPFGRKPALAVKSALATQDGRRTELWLWLDAETGYEGHEESPFLRPLLPLLRVRPWRLAVEAAGTPLAERPELFERARPAQRSDYVRLLVLHNHGGTYVDADTLLLRDLGRLRDDPLLGGELCYQWSARPYANTAVLRLDRGSPVARRLLERCVEREDPRPPAILRFDSGDELDLLVLPCAFFDPLWLHHDGHDLYAGAPLRRFGDFFRPFGVRHRRRREIRSYRDFFPGAFAYHWHNLWDARERRRSYFGLFEAELDALLRARLGVEAAAPSRAG